MSSSSTVRSVAVTKRQRSLSSKPLAHEATARCSSTRSSMPRSCSAGPTSALISPGRTRLRACMARRTPRRTIVAARSNPLRRGVDHVAFLPLLKRVCALKPRVVFATHHLPLVVLGRARRKGWLDAPLVGVVTDYTAHACWAESGVNAFAVPCPRARHELMLHGIEPPRIAVTGLPVRAAFERVRSLRAPAPGERLRVLVTSGGFGVGPIARVVESFAGIDGVELVVVCGRATKLVERVTRVAAEAGVRARVVGFERNMAARVGEAHVVVGKAGGLTISEAMTAGRPLAIVAAVPGNESLNEEFVVDGGGGIASTPDDVGEAIAALHAAGALVEMGRRAAGLVLRAAAERVLELGDALSGRPSLADAA